MTNPRFRADILEGAARSFASGEPSAPDLVALFGQLARVACSDDPSEESERSEESDDGGSLADRADSMIAAALMAHGPQAASLAAGQRLPGAPGLVAWLASPRGPFASALTELEQLGASAAGLGVVAHGSLQHQEALARVRAISLQISEAARQHSAEMLDAAVAAAELIAERGVVPGADDALLALSDVVGLRLDAALRGEPLEAPRAFRLRPIEAGLAARLGEALARALQRERPLEVAPDVMELSRSGGRRRGAAEEDLVLHEARASEPTDRRPVEILRGVHVVFAGSELEVELAAEEVTLLVPIVRGEPALPCPSRSGSHPRHLVFTLDEGHEESEGYALVVGDRIAFLPRQ